MARPNQVDMVERIIRTHEIDREGVLKCVEKAFEALSDDEANALICSLADGEFGGISLEDGLSGMTVRQVRAIGALGRRLWGDPFDLRMRPVILKHCPGCDGLAAMSRRQGARLIVELDRMAAERDCGVLEVTR